MNGNPEQTISELLKRIKDLEYQLKKLKDNAGYGLKWEDKPEFFDEKIQNALPFLKEDKSLFVENDNSLDHIIIEGDNYHVLSTLNYTHKGMIDVIYIDPPYNTGNKDFIYNDNYVDPEDTYRHSKWLSFMDKRLRLAKQLLSDNGVIFISIDDNELANLKLLCDDIFLENNYISLYPRLTVKGGKTQTSLSTSNCDYILGYAKDKKSLSFNKISMENDPAFKYSDEYVDTRGKYHTKQALDTISLGYIKSLDYPIEHDGVTYYPGQTSEPNGYRWTRSKEKYDFAIKNDFVEFKNGRIFPKKYMKASIEKNSKGYYIEYTDKEKNYSQLQFVDNCYSNANGNGDLKEIGLAGYFSYPKSVSLISDLLKMSSKKNSIILDFFAGSGTTGHAVLDLNKQDGGTRQFILCSNRENTMENPDKNICKDVTYERLRRVMQGYIDGEGKTVEGLGGGNLRYYTTEFIEKKRSTDDLRQSFKYLCDELLCIKENTFDVFESKILSDKLKCYYKDNHYTVILYDVREMEKLHQLLLSLNGRISVYIFSVDSCEEDLQGFSDKISLKSIPDDILEIYKKIFKL